MDRRKRQNEPPDGDPRVVLGVALRAALYRRLDAEARRRNVSKSKVLHEALAAALPA